MKMNNTHMSIIHNVTEQRPSHECQGNALSVNSIYYCILQNFCSQSPIIDKVERSDRCLQPAPSFHKEISPKLYNEHRSGKQMIVCKCYTVHQLSLIHI